MTEPVTLTLTRRPELIIREMGKEGRHVIKNPRTGALLSLGPQETFLLLQLDGTHSVAEICTAFEERFGEGLPPEDLGEFLLLAAGRDLLQLPADSQSNTEGGQDRGAPPTSAPASSKSQADPFAPKQSLLYWRFKFFDPDRLFNWLAPRLWFFWTRAFVVLALVCMLSALIIVLFNRDELFTTFQNIWRWQTMTAAFVTVLTVATLHEFAHGLTCKRYGGEVHEIGFLMMFMLPCLYCNVSDAWLFSEKSKRLAVMFAGGFLELFLWSLAVFIWRVTYQDSLTNYLAWVVLSVTGMRVFLNFNPLIKLDGYYVLSDWLDIPNLRQKALGAFTGWLRWLLWGAARPRALACGSFLLIFGVACWAFTLLFLSFAIFSLSNFAKTRLGPAGFFGVMGLGLVMGRGLFHGFTSGEVSEMIRKRFKRAAVWSGIVTSTAAALVFIPFEDRSGGTFEVHALRTEIRAPAAGFIEEIAYDQGDHVSDGTLACRLEIPDLASRLAQKRAEIAEAKAKLELVKLGPRREELTRQEQRVTQCRAVRDLAKEHVGRLKRALAQELRRLEQLIVQCVAELNAATQSYRRAQELHQKSALSSEQLAQVEKELRVCGARRAQAVAEKQAREEKAACEAEAELAAREKDLVEAEQTLELLRAGSRPEEIEAERAHLARLQEELRFLEDREKKLVISSRTSGVIITPRLKEKLGQYVREGDLICVLVDPASLEAEISIPEQEMAKVQEGQAVKLKVRALPHDSFYTKVDRVAPATWSPDTPQTDHAGPAPALEIQGKIMVFSRVPEDSKLRPGMTGYARVYTGTRSLGGFLGDRMIRFLRTQFWW